MVDAVRIAKQMLVSSGTRFTRRSHSLIVGSSSRSSMSATVFDLAMRYSCLCPSRIIARDLGILSRSLHNATLLRYGKDFVENEELIRVLPIEITRSQE
jgi:hypothetical protein